jgi:hypothetical protein
MWPMHEEDAALLFSRLDTQIRGGQQWRCLAVACFSHNFAFIGKEVNFLGVYRVQRHPNDTLG